MNAKEIYSQWTNANNLPDYLKDQLNDLGKDEKWIEDAFGQDINFGTAGMRGRLEPGTNRINLFTVGRVTEGLARLIDENGEEAKKRGVAISFDSRYHSREFAEHAARILGAHGIHVYLFDDLRPTPELSFAVRHLNTFAGINITASHNAKQYNGYKVYGEDGAQMEPENADRLFAYTQKVDDIFSVKAAPVEELRANGTLQLIGEDVDEAYLARLKDVTVDPEMVKANADKLKIIYTPLHGTGKMLYDRAFRQGGFDNVIPVPNQSIIDPEFPTTIKPNPEYRDVFEPGFKLANEVDANVIIFERFQDEIKNRLTPVKAFEKSFKTAMTAIIDGNVTTFAVAILLYIFGIGPIKGFGIVLAIGVLASLFTAIIVTKFLLKQVIHLASKHPFLFGIKKEVK